MPVIIIQSEDGESRVQLESGVVNLGRGLDSDIQINDLRASRKHCQFVKTNDGYKVVDLGSGNGTKVNGVKIRDHLLRSGDLIQIGSTTILFAEDGQAATPPPPARSATPRQVERAAVATQSFPVASQVRNPLPPAPAVVPVPMASPPPMSMDPDQTEVMHHAPMPPAPATPQAYPMVAPAPQLQAPLPQAYVQSEVQPPPAIRPPTSRGIRRGTSRISRSTRRVGTSMTAKYGAKKRGFWTGTKVAVLALLLIFGGGGFFLYKQLSYNLEEEKQKVEDLLKSAAKKENKGLYEEAKNKLKEAADKVNKDNNLKKVYEQSVGQKLLEIDDKVTRSGEADTKVKELEKKLQNIPPSQVDKLNELIREVEKEQARYSDLTAVVEKFKAFTAKVKEAIDKAPKDSDKWYSDLIAEYPKLVNEEKKYSEAFKKVLEFRDKLLPEEKDKKKWANDTLGSINSKAKYEVSQFKKEAENQLKNGKSKDEVKTFLQQQMPRFEGTEGEDALKGLNKFVDDFELPNK